MSSAKLTLIGFYDWYNQIGEDFFKNLTVPEELDRTTLITHILQKGGEFETLYANPEMLMTMMSVWSKSWYHTIEKWIETMSTEYKPLENYDRYEDWGDTGKGHATDSSNGSSSANGYDNVSAYNSSVMQPDSSNSANSNTSANSISDSTTENSHTGHIHGNIGVTTSAQMATGEMEMRLAWGNLYDHVADLFLHECVIPLYD